MIDFSSPVVVTNPFKSKPRISDRASWRPYLACTVLSLMLFTAFSPLRPTENGDATGHPGAASPAYDPSAASPIMLTNTSSDNFFLTGRNTIIGGYYLPYFSNNLMLPISVDDTQKASGVSVAWGNPASGQIAFSRPSSTGGIEPYNVSLSPGEQLYQFIPGISSVPAQQDNATILASETNSATGASGYTLYDTSAGKQFDLPSLPQFYDYGTGSFVTPSPSSWGDNLVGVSDITIPGTNTSTPVVLQYDITPGTSGYETWQQVSPSDWTTQTGCIDNIPPVYRPTVPIQALASGPKPSNFVWARIDLAVSPCVNSIYDGSFNGTDVMYGNSSSPILYFPTNATTYNGLACSPVWAGNTCFEGLVGAWGNIILYSVSGAVYGSDNLWLHDMSNGANILLQSGVNYLAASSEAGGWIPGFWSDGHNAIMITLNDTVKLYESATGLVKAFNTNALVPGATRGMVRVSGSWAVWLDSNDTLSFYNMATDKLYQQPVDSLNPNAFVDYTNFDFENGIATWLVNENSPSPQLVLFTFNATAASMGNLAVARTVLNWAQLPPFGSLTFPQVALSSSGAWTFVDTQTTTSSYYQVAAFATPQPTCSYTAVSSGGWTSSDTWINGAGNQTSPPLVVPSGCSVYIYPSETVTIPLGTTVQFSTGSRLEMMKENMTTAPPAHAIVVNLGSLLVNHGANVTNDGTISNSGNVTISGTLTTQGQGEVSNSGTINIKGLVFNTGNFTLLPSLSGPGSIVSLAGPGAQFYNYGLITIEKGSGLSVANGAVFNSAGSSTIPGTGVVNNGNVISYGTFDVYLHSSMTNNGNITNEKQGDFILKGNLNQNATGPVYLNFGKFDISGGSLTDGAKVTNDGVVAIDEGSYILILHGGVFTDDAGTVTIAGTVTNGGTLINEANDTITVQAGGTLDNEQTLDNAGMISNLGTITNAGTISNVGTISNSGNISNLGAISNSGKVFGTGSITGNSVSSTSVSSVSSVFSTTTSLVSATRSSQTSSSTSGQPTKSSSSSAIGFSSLATIVGFVLVVFLALIFVLVRRRGRSQHSAPPS